MKRFTIELWRGPSRGVVRVVFNAEGFVCIKEPLPFFRWQLWFTVWRNGDGYSEPMYTAGQIKAILAKSVNKLVETEMLPLAYLAHWRRVAIQ